VRQAFTIGVVAFLARNAGACEPSGLPDVQSIERTERQRQRADSIEVRCKTSGPLWRVWRVEGLFS